MSFTSIRTSKDNKEIVSNLTQKLGLGAENIVARLAYTYSLSKDKQLKLIDIKDAQGKEYTKHILFGEYEDVYIAMVCVHYDIHKSNKDVPKYIKLHIDHGLELLNREYGATNNISGLEFLVQKMSTV
jgi:DNA sulfur modification protein DndE